MKYEHKIIQDLMPLCIDGAGSEESRTAIQAHIAKCAECAAIWNSMQTDIPAFSGEEAVPDPETSQYKAAAKRMRKRNRRRLLRGLCAVLVLAGCGWFGVLYHFGLRFTPFAAVKHGIDSVNETGIYNRYEPWHAPANTAAELCTVIGDNRHFSMTAAMEKDSAGNPLAVYFTECDRRDWYSFGMWNTSISAVTAAGSGGFEPVYAEFIGYAGSRFVNPLWAVCYVTDDAVKTVELRAGAKTYRLEPVNGAAVQDCSDYKFRQNSYDKLTENPAFVHGTAYDAEGNVLYVYDGAAENHWVKQ